MLGYLFALAAGALFAYLNETDKKKVDKEIDKEIDEIDKD